MIFPVIIIIICLSFPFVNKKIMMLRQIHLNFSFSLPSVQVIVTLCFLGGGGGLGNLC